MLRLAQRLSNDIDSRKLYAGEVFGFGGDTLILTNKLKQRNSMLDKDGIRALLTENHLYTTEATLKANLVKAAHGAQVREDAKIGKLTLKDIGKILHDPQRLGRTTSSRGAWQTGIQTKNLERRKVLGAGTFGTVWLTRDAATDAPYALKVQYKRQLIESHQAKGVIREKNVMSRMHHPFVLNLLHAEQDEARLYMVLDFMQGGELGSVMHTRERKHLAEGSARFYAAGILEGLSYMHRRHYIYRDLKGENVLLDNQGYAVIVDLGFGELIFNCVFVYI